MRTNGGTRLCVAAVMTGLFCGMSPGSAQEATSIAQPAVQKGGEYLLPEFGDVSTPAAVKATFDRACADIVTKGGGVLVIPPAVTVPFEPQNTAQKDRESGPTVTVRDLRKGYEVRLVPSVGLATPTGWFGQYTYRLINMKEHGLPFQGNHEATGIRNAVVRGASSYMQWTTEPAKKGKDAHIYVPSIRGIFVGQYLTYCSSAGYAPPHDRIWVKGIGWDAEKKANYVIADLEYDHPAGAILYNKHVVGSQNIDTTSNCDNQTMEFQVTRRQYSHGDSFLISGMYCYQGDVFSGLGDECGVVLNSEVCSDPDPFHSEVEKVDWADNAITFKPGVSNVQKLATSRTIVNLNPKKWLTQGSVVIVPPEDWGGFIVNRKGFDTMAFVHEGIDLSKFPLTYQDQGKELTGLSTWDGKPIRSLKYVYKGKAYPSLIASNINWLGGCILGSADCGWTPDVVGRFFAVNEPAEYLAPGEPTEGGMYAGGAVARITRRWYLIKEFRKNADGTCAIRIERIRWAAVPAGAPNLYDAESYTWDGHEKPLKYVIAPGAYAYDVGDGWKDRVGGYANADESRIVRVVPNGDRGTAFDFAAGDAIEQGVGADPAIPQPMRVRVFNAVPDTLEASGLSMSNGGKVAMHAGITIGGTGNNLDSLKNRKDHKAPWLTGVNIGSVTENGIVFGADVTSAAIRFTQPNERPQPLLWEHLKGQTTLTVDPKSGDMAVTGGALHASAVKAVQGISGTAVAAANLRRIDVAVPQGVRRLEVKFEKPEADAAYAVMVQPNWLTLDGVTQKTTAGFTVEFSAAAPAAAHLDWLLVR